MPGDSAPETSEAAARVPEASPDALRWRVRPADQHPGKLGVVAAAACLALVAGWALLASPLLGLLGFAIILASTAEFWLGSSYRVDSRGASARVGLSVTSMAWEDVKRVIVEEGAVRLSPLAEPGPLDPFRGVALKAGPEGRAPVLEAVRRHVGDDVRFLGE